MCVCFLLKGQAVLCNADSFVFECVLHCKMPVRPTENWFLLSSFIWRNLTLRLRVIEFAQQLNTSRAPKYYNLCAANWTLPNSFSALRMLTHKVASPLKTLFWKILFLQLLLSSIWETPLRNSIFVHCFVKKGVSSVNFVIQRRRERENN